MRNLKIATKIITMFLTIGIIGILILGLLSYNQSKKFLMQKSFEQLISIRDIKKNQIESFFTERFGDIKIYANNAALQMAAERFIAAFESVGLNGDLYKKWDNYHGNNFQDYILEYGYYDLFIISPSGDIVYTVAKESDLGLNISSAKLKNTGIAEAFNKGKSSISLIDFSWYEISNEPASFISGPIKNDNGDLIGVLAYQISLGAINGIMQERSGMGETGETYLVGEDKLMRSDSYLDPKGHSVKASFAGTVQENGVNTIAANNALSGQIGSDIIIDYNNNPVLSAYTPVKVGDFNWALLAEIDNAEIMHPINTLARIFFFIAIAICTVIVIVSLLFAKSIANPLAQGVDFAQKLSEGDLTATLNINQKDEIGQLAIALTNMGTKLNEIVQSIMSGSDNIAAASQQMSTTSQQMSQGASEQASSVEEVSSSMEEMAANIQNNTDNAQQTKKIAFNSVQSIKEGSFATNTAVDAMKNIAEKIKIINDIAFQTNILALNAAVEAARAGEHGKGFAVVASEVRKLAERSKISADEIDELSSKGVNVAEKAGRKLEEIVPDIDKTSQLVQEIASASQEQNSGADQVNSAMQQLNNVTQQNAAASEEMSTSSEELASQAEQLKDIISFFKTDNELSSFKKKPYETVVNHLPNQKMIKPSGKDINQIKFTVSNIKSDEEFENF